MANNRKQRLGLQREITLGDAYANLKPSDKAVLKYLNNLILNNDGETCTASIPKIASMCDLSERQVQISTKRLIGAGLLERIGYDFSNPVREKRGTIYKVLIQRNGTRSSPNKSRKKRSIKFFRSYADGMSE
ncbi:MAG: Helix-turn-helix domain [Blastocatellia bacterium]|jgi:DNA-binding Lrp family transcriptional regulator|nr:Helix-turn-helix domain [Blastocatellia bacterium]